MNRRNKIGQWYTERDAKNQDAVVESEVTPNRTIALTAAPSSLHSQKRKFSALLLSLEATSNNQLYSGVHFAKNIFRGNDENEINHIKQALDATFNIKNRGVTRTKHGIAINQRKYALELLSDAGLLYL